MHTNNLKSIFGEQEHVAIQSVAHKASSEGIHCIWDVAGSRNYNQTTKQTAEATIQDDPTYCRWKCSCTKNDPRPLPTTTWLTCLLQQEFHNINKSYPIQHDPSLYMNVQGAARRPGRNSSLNVVSITVLLRSDRGTLTAGHPIMQFPIGI